jgi:DNA polymerase I-like protein with 3'-5' exonuclease and polymerase domains
LFEVAEADAAEAGRVAADAMRNAIELEAPLRVGVEVGPNWADLARI